MEVVTIDADRYRAVVGDKSCNLSPSEFRLASYLSAQPEFVRSRGDIMREVCGAHVCERTIDILVSRLRRKLRTLGASEQIVTRPRLGYSWGA